MRLQMIITAVVLGTFPATASFEQTMTCFTKEAALFDDGRSDAISVARAVRQQCQSQISVAIGRAIGASATDVRTLQQVNNQRDVHLDMAVAAVLGRRVIMGHRLEALPYKAP